MATTDDSRKATLGLDFTSIIGNSNITGSGVLTSALVTVDGELLVRDAGGGGGDATSANQVLQLDQETVTASNTSTIDGKISRGEQTTITGGTGGLQQVLLYGKDVSNDLHPIRITPNGDIDVEIADFVKGQDIMANSFPCVLASDQSAITVSETFLRATQSIDFTVPASSNNTSSGVNMSPGGDPTYRKIAIFGETDNLTELEMYVQFSNDNLSWFTGGYDEVIQLAPDPNDPTKQVFYKVIDSPPQWVRCLKFNTTLSLETLSVKTARIN